MVLTGAQMDAARHRIRQWESTVPPCGISTADIYCPCLPERDERGLWCATCGLRQRLEIEAGQERAQGLQAGVAAGRLTVITWPST